jgi:hypothetical protein
MTRYRYAWDVENTTAAPLYGPCFGDPVKRERRRRLRELADFIQGRRGLDA